MVEARIVSIIGQIAMRQRSTRCARALLFEENAMNGRPRTKAAKKRRVLIKKERRERKTLSRVMPMLSRPKARG
jgi:hypothetical protein